MQTNPYVPWSSDPAGALLAPLALLAMVYGRKKKRGKWDTIIILLILSGAIGLTLTACTQPVTVETPIAKATIAQHPTQLQNYTITIEGTTESGEFKGSITLTPTGTIEPPCSISIFQITKDDIVKAGGTMEKYLKTEDEALLMARVAMGEATENEEERIRVMWLIKIRIELGYQNASKRPIPTTLFYMSHWGEETDIYQELFTQLDAFEVIKGITNVTDPENDTIPHHLKAMVYPTEDQKKDLCNTYEYAKMIANENLLTSTDKYLDQVKGYDEYRASNLLEGEIGHQNWGWALGAEGGKYTQVFGTDRAKLNAWRDIWPVDNVYFGFTKCETLKGLVDAAPQDNFPNWIKNPTCSN